MLVISGIQPGVPAYQQVLRFNLAIEMLVISGAERELSRLAEQIVSISQSRCLSFQESSALYASRWTRSVSISQSRCLSFQVQDRGMGTVCPARFNLAIEMLIISG